MKLNGSVAGISEREAALTLVSRGIFPSRLSVDSTAPEKVKDDDLIIFTERLASLVSAGVPLISILENLETQSLGRLRQTIQHMLVSAKEGKPLHESMAQASDVFPGFFVALVAVGERTGRLERVLKELTAMLERRRDLKEAVEDAARYPKIVLTVAAAGLVALMGFVIPRYAAIFTQAGVPLPLPTRALISMDILILGWWPYLLSVAAVGYLLIRRWLEQPAVRAKVDEWILHIPVMGRIALNSALARWADALGNLLAAGAPIIESIEFSAKAAGNSSLENPLVTIRAGALEGLSLAHSMKSINLLPPSALQIIAAGEEAGALDGAFFNLRGYFIREAQRSSKKISAYVEPALILGVGLVVFFLALSVFLPMWDMASLARRGG